MSLSSSAEIGPVDEPLVPRSVLPSASPWFVAFCMVVISASLAALLYLRAGMTVAEAGWIGFGALMIMVLAEFYSARSRERAAVESDLQEVARLSASITGDVASLDERIADIEATLTIRIEGMIEEKLETVLDDLRRLEERIDGLAETVAAFEHTPAPVTVAARPVETFAAPQEDVFEDEDDAEENEDPAFPGMRDADIAVMLRRAVEDIGPEIHLQSIVTLPQRRVRYYEAFVRLKDPSGRTLMPRQFIPAAERTGVMPIVDNAVLFRSVQIIRKMARKSGDVGVFCNISARSLSDADFFQQFIEFMGDNRQLSKSIIFEFTQAAFNELSPVELANLDSLAELGFRFSIDNVTRLDFDCAAIAARGVRYIKVDAETLIQPPRTATANIHAADLAALLARYGIELIATRVETEVQVIDILDYDVKFAQGHLFSPPRPVRADVVRDDRPAAR